MQQDQKATARGTSLERHWRTNELAEILGVSRQLVEKEIARGRIGIVRIGTAVTVPDSEVKRYIEARRIPSRSQCA